MLPNDTRFSVILRSCGPAGRLATKRDVRRCLVENYEVDWVAVSLRAALSGVPWLDGISRLRHSVESAKLSSYGVVVGGLS